MLPKQASIHVCQQPLHAALHSCPETQYLTIGKQQLTHLFFCTNPCCASYQTHSTTAKKNRTHDQTAINILYFTDL